MADIRIDTSNLTYTQFLIPELSSEPIDGANAPTIQLEPGEYSVQQVLGLPASFSFQITPDGLISYDTANDQFLSGRGTTTLLIQGFTITIDGRALSHDLLPQNLLGNGNVLPRNLANELTYLPATGYTFYTAPGIAADFHFDLDVSGQVILDPRYAGFATARGQILTLSGYRITIDGRALSHDLLPQNLLGNGDVLPRNLANELTYLPAAGYTFYTASGIAADFHLDLDVSGQIILNPRYAGFATARGQILTLSGYRITIDGRALSHDLLPQNLLGNSEVLPRNLVNELTYLPAAGYTFYTASGIAADFHLDLDVSGQIILNPRSAGFATARGQILTLSGYRITIDGRALSHDLLPQNLLGNGNVLPRNLANELTYLPATGYTFYTAPGIAADFHFDLDVSGQVILAPRYAGFATARGQILTLSGYRITIDGRALSHDLLPQNLLGNGNVLPRNLANELTYLPAAGYTFYTASGIAADFHLDLDVSGQIILNPRYAGFATARGQILTLTGYRITIDGRTLSHDLLPQNLLGNSDVLPRNLANELTYLPAAGYTFYTASGIAADFHLDLDVSGQIILNPRYAGFATARGQILTLTGYRITIDGRALSHDLLPQNLLGNSEVLPRNLVNELTYLPAAGYAFQSAQDVPADFSFDISTDGRVVVASRFADFTQTDGSRLIFRINMSPNPGESRTFQVVGKVTTDILAILDRLQVAIVDKNIGSDVTLFETLTDFEGNYSTAFIYAGQKQKPDLQARVLRNGVFLGASEVRYNAANNETLNIAVESAVDVAPTSEYEMLLSAISQHFTGNLQDLQETAERQDITYLANKTGWDARSITLASLADQFSSNTIDASGSAAIEPAAFYSLFREGLLSDEVALYQTDAQQVKEIWKKGIENQIIPAELEGRIPQMIDKFKQLGVERLLRGAPSPQGMAAANPVRELLALSLGQDEAQTRKFAELKIQHGSNPPIFWEQIRAELGEQTERRLQLDGQLAALTINNVPLINKLHEQTGEAGLSDPMSLVNQGFYQAEKWQEVIGTDTVIPPEIAGKSDAEKRSNYANLLAGQIQLSYPTAVIAQMVDTEQITLTSPEAPKQNVVAFLKEHQGSFELGVQPIERYIATNNLPITPGLEQVAKEVTRIQRVHQITPNDEAMHALLKQPGLDSAYAVVRYGREAFVQAFKDEMGGEANARLTYAKAEQVHNTVLNLAMSYQLARTAPAIGSNTTGLIINPAPNVPTATAANAGDVLAYPTLEGLFGEMDYCTCEHCRSFLSPAAYLVDLLMFIDNQTVWEAYTTHWNALHPGELLPNTEIPPLQVLLNRRPDIQHLPLTCENTNGVVPYIDLVNETLEYFVTNNLNLESYAGHSTEDDSTPEELLASPQFVSDKAYEALAGRPLQEGASRPLLPPISPLPFHQSLENLRRYFDRFEVPLPQVMEMLRQDDNLDRANENGYGWRDILLEDLRVSRPEYTLLTDSTRTLQELFGYPLGTPEVDVLSNLSNAKAFTRRVGITYEEIVNILQTRFINPVSTILPKLEQLRVPFATLKTLKESPLTGQDWLDLLPQPLPDASQYGGNIETWVKNDTNFAKIMRLITLADPTNQGDVCSFDHLEFRYANPDALNTFIRSFEFIRLIRFIRLWKKLGWSLEQMDKIIAALYPTDQTLDDPDDAVNLQRLDAGFKILLPRIGIIQRVMKLLELNPASDLLSLLACFAPIDTHGMVSLYRQMFLSPTLLKQAPAFADNGFGEFLGDRTQKLLDQTETLRAAFQLTDDEFSAIVAALSTDNTLIDRDENNSLLLTLKNISAVFRWGWLARKLKLSVRELVVLTQVTGIDPFAAPDAPNPPILHLLDFIDRLRASSLPLGQALYLIWNQDISGQSAPTESNILQFARTLRADFATIASEFTLVDDPEGKIARDRMALVYGSESTDFFFGLLNQTIITAVPYSHPQDQLEPPILNAALGRIAYDNLRKQLSFIGILSADTRDLLKATAPRILEFQQAIDHLFEKNQKVVGPFFERYPELRSLYAAYEFFGELKASVSYTHGQSALEKPILDIAQDRLVYDHTLDQLSYVGVLSTDKRDALKNILGVSTQFQAALDSLYTVNQNAIDGFFNLYPENLYPELWKQRQSYLIADNSVKQRHTILLANFLPQLQQRRNRLQALQAISAIVKVDLGFANTLLNDQFNDKYVLPAADLTRPALDDLTAIKTDTTTISNNWIGYLEAPETGFYNFRIATDAGTIVTFTLDDKAVELDPNGRNNAPIELSAGQLYEISIQVSNERSSIKVHWQTASRGWEMIPSRYLYSGLLIDRLRTVYIRFLKSASLAAALRLTANEIAHFAKSPDYQIDAQSWLNHLLVTGSPSLATSIALLNALTGLLDFAHLKSELAAEDEQLLTVLKDPTVATQNPDSLLYRLTRWESRSLTTLLTHFGQSISDLSQIATFRRVHHAFGLVKKMGIPVSVLLQAATNEPNADIVINLQSSLRSRYDEKSWLSVLKPINDEMRRLQRDALVAYILHQLRANPETAHINTPEKLFEYFLMDVQMEPCMQTSRIRHALSSVQLFIERSLMNLEPQVAPLVIDAAQWQWKKRYRMWEANRKIFLYPENWLEPELRDNQSPFFKETISELLQSDITEEKAATALLTYLSKLDEVAKLEPCGIHVIENKLETSHDIALVVARTAGANRKYYSRRCESGSWTPWEHIKLDIEDNPVTPFVWKGRTFLFWVRILKQPPMDGPAPINAPPETSLGFLQRSQVTIASPEIRVQAVLCWSEYYNGKWQPTKTSDINNPADLGSFKPQDFDRSKLNLGVYKQEEQLKILVFYPIGEEYYGAYFFIRNTHSVPLSRRRLDGWDPYSMGFELLSQQMFQQTGYLPYRSLQPSTSAPKDLTLQVKTKLFEGFQLIPVLQNRYDSGHRTIEPLQLLQNSLEAPFFYEDNNHVFYVTTSDMTRNFQAIITDNNVFYGVLDSGKLLWFKDDRGDGTNVPNGSTGWDPRSGAWISQISQGWQNFKFLLSGGDGIIYGVLPTGELFSIKIL